MDRLTESDWKERFDLKELHPRYKKLATYEDTGLTPEEIKEHEEMFTSYRHICGGKSP